MADPITTPTFPTLLQRFFVEHLGHQRAVSPRTIESHRTNICQKLNLRGSHSLMRFALAHLSEIESD